MAANIFSSASWHKSTNVGRFADTKRLRSLRRMNAARRWRSDAAAKPHQALEACINPLSHSDAARHIVFKTKITYNIIAKNAKIISDRAENCLQWDVIHAVGAQDSESIYKVCALELITAWTCSATERLFVNVTPRIFRVVTRAMTVRGGGGWDFFFFLWSTKTISANLAGLV